MNAKASKFADKVMERVRFQMACLGYHLIDADESSMLDRIRDARRRLADLENQIEDGRSDRAA